MEFDSEKVAMKFEKFEDGAGHHHPSKNWGRRGPQKGAYFVLLGPSSPDPCVCTVGPTCSSKNCILWIIYMRDLRGLGCWFWLWRRDLGLLIIYWATAMLSTYFVLLHSEGGLGSIHDVWGLIWGCMHIVCLMNESRVLLPLNVEEVC